jgi:hypothetical protein
MCRIIGVTSWHKRVSALALERQIVNRQVEIKIEQIARMVVKGMKLTQIAIEMGMSYTGLVAITRRPEYLTIEEQVRTGTVGKMDARLAKRAQMEIEVEDTLPDAMRVLIEGVTKKRDLKAALELLDRDPRRQFAKGAAGASQAAQQTGAQAAATAISSEALATAVRDADLTHQILKNQTTSVQAPGVGAKSDA